MESLAQTERSWRPLELPLSLKLFSCGMPCLLLGGCGAAIPVVILGIVAATEDDSSSDRPRIVEIASVPSPACAGRPTDLERVELTFKLIERTREKAKLAVEFLRDGWEPAELAEPLGGFATSPGGVQHTVTWNAAQDGFTGYNEVQLRFTARDGDGKSRGERTILMGNSAPEVTRVEIATRSGGDTVSQNVVVEFELEDRGGDPMCVDFLISTDGGEEFRSLCGCDPRVEACNFPASDCPDLFAGGQAGLSPGEHRLVWDSIESLCQADVEDVVVGIRPTDFLGKTGELRKSNVVRVNNNSLPEVVVVEPVANSDADGPVRLNFLVRDPEGDAADLVLQWSETGEFAALSDLGDVAVRERILQDPDERASRNIVTPRLRTIFEARVRTRRSLSDDEVALAGITPPGVIVEERLRGAVLELFAEGGALEQRREIVGVDPRFRTLQLSAIPRPRPRDGQLVRVSESVTGLFLGVGRRRRDAGDLACPQSSFTGGVEHDLAWDAPSDLGTSVGTTGTLFRATAVAGREFGPSFTSTIAKGVRVRLPRFSPPVRIATEGGPVCAGIGDVDGNGRPDLVAVTSGPGRLHVFVQDRDRTFGERQTLPLDGDPRSVAAADLDDDGHLDIAVAVRDSGMLAILHGRGDGSFEPWSTLRTGALPSSVAVADVNGDGSFDVISADAGESRLSVFFGTEGAPLDEPLPLPTGDSPAFVLAVDLDGDGDTDLISADEGENRLSVFVGSGDGTFCETEILRTGIRPFAVAAADLDSDGRLDLVSADRFEDQLSVFLGDERGVAASDCAELLPGPHPEPIRTGPEPFSVAAADVNGDGIVDLLSTETEGLSVFLGSGGGAFEALDPLPAGDRPGSMVTADLNGDELPDLVVADFTGKGLTIFLSEREGDFPGPHPLPLATGDGPEAILAADLDGDGHLDLVSADAREDQLSVFLGSGNGTFPEPRSTTLRSIRPSALAAGDLDGDGDLDLVSSESRLLPVFLGAGDGTFPGPHPPPLRVSGRPRAVLLEDLNDDGNLDLVTASFEFPRGRILIFRGAGDGTFPDPPVDVPTGAGAFALAAADLDRDGHLDLVSADLSAGQLSIFLGAGDGSFPGPHPESLVTLGGPSSVVVADMDGDGHLDLISPEGRENHISVFLGDGDGTFSRRRELPSGRGPISAVAADVNGDGHLDVISADMDDDQISIFLGAGDGTFPGPHPPPIPTGNAPRSLLAVDLNGDGQIDLASADNGSDQLSILLNGARRPESPRFFGTRRIPRPTTGNGLGGDLRLEDREAPYVVDTSAGTIDGERLESALQGRSYHFASITIARGATVIAVGEYPLVLLATGDVRIDGKLLLDGESARDAGATAGRNHGSSGGRGGAGGALGGDGGGTFPGTGRAEGGRGGGSGGGEGGRPSLPPPGASSGAGGGHGTAGTEASSGARGGTIYGNELLDPLFGGSGGGGGSIGDADGSRGVNPGDNGGGGGGGGGGALRITAGGDIVIAGTLSANGGDGARGNADRGGHGGGGAGGSILLQAGGAIRVLANGVVSAVGGQGAGGEGPRRGGDGGHGRILFEDDDRIVEQDGRVKGGRSQ